MLSSGDDEKGFDVEVHSLLNELIAERSRDTRQRVTQQEIIAATGLNANTVSRWMNPALNFKKPDLAVAYALAEFLGVEWYQVVRVTKVPKKKAADENK